MTYDDLREDVWKANLEIVEAGLVELTWGNVSGADRDAGVMAIKPSGVPYDVMSPKDIVVISLESGKIVAGDMKPSSDTATHRVLYQHFDHLGGIVHTHSTHAVSWAQAERDIPCLGTTHADHFYGAVPVTRRMRADEIQTEYEYNTGRLIVECFHERGISPLQVPAVLVACHGPFAWGSTPAQAVENAVVLESAAGMALQTVVLHPSAAQIDQVLLDKHYLRKHGDTAYYGQD